MSLYLRIEDGNGQSATINQAYSERLRVQLLDNATIPPTPAVGGTVQFQNTSGDLVNNPSAPFTGGVGTSTVEVGAGGYATSAALRANGIAGHVTIRAWTGGTQVLFSLTNKVPSGPPKASGVVTGTGDDQVVLQGQPPSTAITVVVTDQYDAVFPGATVIFNMPTTGPSGTFTADGGITASVVTNSSGVAQCPNFLATDQIGHWQIIADVSGTELFNSPDLFGAVQATINLYTNPANGVEVCTTALVPTSAITVANPGAQSAWGNAFNWTALSDGGVTQNFIGQTEYQEYSDYLQAYGFGLNFDAIPDEVEITRITIKQFARNNSVMPTILRLWMERPGFPTPKITTTLQFTPPADNVARFFTSAWSAFTTPNPGSKLLGKDLKVAGFKVVQYNQANTLVTNFGQTTLQQLTATICYITPNAPANVGLNALQFCEV